MLNFYIFLRKITDSRKDVLCVAKDLRGSTSEGHHVVSDAVSSADKRLISTTVWPRSDELLMISYVKRLTSAHRRPTTFPLPTPTHPSTTFEFRWTAVFGGATSPDSRRRSSTTARWRTVHPAAAAVLLNFLATGRPQREVWEGGVECKRPRRHPRLRHRRRPRRLCLSSI